MKNKPVIKKCVVCNTKFEFGYDGIWTEEGYKCDKCAQVTRIADDYSSHTAWTPDELGTLAENR